ncbi:MAG: proline--tRNA ligase [Chloroflexi bacterium]|nr:proline--tRNA ligase [Chloroflexota bacterium]
MRISNLFGRTLRDAPAEAEIPSHQLALRAALVRFIAPGIHCYLPLGWRVVQRIEGIVRDEMASVGAQELQMPSVHPAELRRLGGVRNPNTSDVICFRDRSKREYTLALTDEEAIAELARREIRSYRDLPCLVFHTQTRFWDPPHLHSGLIRSREFRLMGAYGLHSSRADLDRSYAEIMSAYQRVFSRCGLDVTVAHADTELSECTSHEFLLPHSRGDSTLVRCARCGYSANIECATSRLEPSPLMDPTSPKTVATPDCRTIADVAAFLGVHTSQIMKAVLYTIAQRAGDQSSPDELVFALIRGDQEVNEAKLLRHLGGGELRPATDEEILAAGAVPGYASPLGLNVRHAVSDRGVLVVVDPSIQSGADVVVGANLEGHHTIGVSYPQDFDVTLVADIRTARDGQRCPQCDGFLSVTPAIELGYCHTLGTQPSNLTGATYLDRDGQSREVAMGAYGIVIERLIAAIIEAHHDEFGIVWPPAVAPFAVHIVALGADPDVQSVAEGVCTTLENAGMDVLFDDRDESPGVKFADADLIGCPVRATVSRRSLSNGGIEMKLRHEKDRNIVAFEGLVSVAQKALSDTQPVS